MWTSGEGVDEGRVGKMDAYNDMVYVTSIPALLEVQICGVHFYALFKTTLIGLRKGIYLMQDSLACFR